MVQVGESLRNGRDSMPERNEMSAEQWEEWEEWLKNAPKETRESPLVRFIQEKTKEDSCQKKRVV